MILFENQTNLCVELTVLEKILQDQGDNDVEFILTDSENIQRINKEFRGKDSATDVLSFPLDTQIPHAPLGSIVINADLALQKAKELGHTFEDEIALLFIHGLLHLLGYDHEIDNGQMREKEKEMILRYDLPKSLIIRTQG
jgi:probable rRNA maturation factor